MHPLVTSIFTPLRTDQWHLICYGMWLCDSFDDTLGVYVGDCYSVNWLENSDAIDLGKETLEEQYQIVKDKTDMSEVSSPRNALW